jgi:hypothetical protein
MERHKEDGESTRQLCVCAGEKYNAPMLVAMMIKVVDNFYRQKSTITTNENEL